METGELKEKLTELKRLGELGLITEAQVQETTNQLLKVFVTPKQVLHEQNEQKIQLAAAGQQQQQQQQWQMTRNELEAPVTPYRRHQQYEQPGGGDLADDRGFNSCTVTDSVSPRAALELASSSRPAQSPVVADDRSNISALQIHRPCTPVKANSQHPCRQLAPTPSVELTTPSPARPSSFPVLPAHSQPSASSNPSPAESLPRIATKSGLDSAARLQPAGGGTQPHSAVPSTRTCQPGHEANSLPPTIRADRSQSLPPQTNLVRPVDQHLFDALKRHLQQDSLPSAASGQSEPLGVPPVPNLEGADVRQETSAAAKHVASPLRAMSADPSQDSNSTRNAHPAVDLHEIMKPLLGESEEVARPSALARAGHLLPRRTESLPEARMLSSLPQQHHQQPAPPSEGLESFEALRGVKSQTDTPGLHHSQLQTAVSQAFIHLPTAPQLPAPTPPAGEGADSAGQPNKEAKSPQVPIGEGGAPSPLPPVPQEPLDIHQVVHTLGQAVATAGLKPGTSPASILQALLTATQAAQKHHQPGGPVAPISQQRTASPPHASPPASEPAQKPSVDLRHLLQALGVPTGDQQLPGNHLPAQMAAKDDPPTGCGEADSSTRPAAPQRHDRGLGSTPQAAAIADPRHSGPRPTASGDHHLPPHVEQHPDLSEVFHEIFSVAEHPAPHPEPTSELLATDSAPTRTSAPAPSLYSMFGEGHTFDPLLGFEPHDSSTDLRRTSEIPPLTSHMKSGQHSYDQTAPTRGSTDPVDSSFAPQVVKGNDCHQPSAHEAEDLQQLSQPPDGSHPASLYSCSATAASSLLKPKEACSPPQTGLEPCTPSQAAGNSQPSTPPPGAVCPPQAVISPTGIKHSLSASPPAAPPSSTAPAPGLSACDAVPGPAGVLDLTPPSTAEALASAIPPAAVRSLTASATPGASLFTESSSGEFKGDWVPLAELATREAAEKWLVDTGFVYQWCSGGGKKGGHIQMCKSHENCPNRVRITAVESMWQVSSRGAHLGPELLNPSKGIHKKYLEDIDKACRANIDPHQIVSDLQTKYGAVPDLPTTNQIRNRKRTIVRQDKGLNKRPRASPMASSPDSNTTTTMVELSPQDTISAPPSQVASPQTPAQRQ